MNKKFEYEIIGEYTEIVLSGKYGKGKFLLIDTEDLPLLASHRSIYVSPKGYAIQDTTNYARTEGKRETVHRIVTEAKRGETVDHKDGNKLNCRKKNLRVTTQANNMRNTAKRKDGTSKHKGVYWNKILNKWTARINLNKTAHILGHFEDEDDAGKAYNIKAIELFGEFSRLNDIDHSDFTLEEYTPRTESSQYRGVSCSNASSKAKNWSVHLWDGKKQIFVGRYYSEYEAACAYNLKSIELFGDDAQLNAVDHENVVFEKTRKNSKYKGVSVNRGKFAVHVCVKDTVKYCGIFKDEENAAKKYNLMALELIGPDAELNDVDHTTFVENPRKKFRGVYHEKRNGKYRTMVTADGKSYRRGYFDTELEAAKVYNELVIEHGLDKPLNDIPEGA